MRGYLRGKFVGNWWFYPSLDICRKAAADYDALLFTTVYLH